MVKETPFIYPRRTLVPGPNATPTAARAKLKHMDSQISFTAVDDTPEFETQDPQLLTERQKEVRVENAETAGMFPEITGSVVKRKKGLKLAAGSPTPNRKLDFAQTPVAEKNEERVPETTVEGLKDTEPIFSFTSDPRSGTSAAGSVNESSGSRSQMHDDRSSELTDIDSDNDVAMSNYEFSEPTKALEPQADTASDVPSVEEMFVDAPEHPNAPELAPVQTKASDYGKISPLKDISEIAILVSPVKNITEYEPVDISDPDSPPARQQKSTAEKRATPAAAVTPQKGKAGKKLNKKRKRTASAPGSPEVLDTIIIAESEQSPQDPEPPSKKPKASDSGVDTPIRISARKTKGKTGVRGTASKLSAGSDVDGMGGKLSAWLETWRFW